MDSNCDYLLYTKVDDNHEEYDYESCALCYNYPIQKEAICLNYTPNCSTPIIPLDVALSECMSTHIEALDMNDESIWTDIQFTRSETMLRFLNRDRNIIALQGAIHMRDVSPNGTWLSEMSVCVKSVSRLKLAGMLCMHLPELNKIVIEQKNDDGLLYLANKWLLKKNNISEAIELFGPFACDAMLAPILHVILRSDWIKERKKLGENNNELKLGWAQEFYNWKSVTVTRNHCMVFTHHRKCPNQNTRVHGHRIITFILDKMRWCGYTPWSAVEAVRCSENLITKIECAGCKSLVLTSCVFLMECAAAEASKKHDWLVRNEAVVQLCWLLYHIHEPEGYDAGKLIDVWSKSIMLHSIAFHEYKVKTALCDLESLVVMFANDHLSVWSHTTVEPKDKYHCLPNSEILEVLKQNNGFASKEEPVVYPIRSEEDVNISISVDVLTEASDTMEARAQDVDTIVQALVSCFPRVSALALDQLTLMTPNTKKFSGLIWPVFVNSTRACYQLFKALALPVSPSPVYILELLARAWRRVASEVLECFTPMSTGGVVKVSCEHYMNYFRAPLETLATFNIISTSERNLMIDILRNGVLPCFAGRGDSTPDQLVNSTIALTFAACGLRVFSGDKSDSNDVDVYITSAGLLYFAAWYLLVYAAALHTQPILKKKVSHAGSDADKHLCAALKLGRGKEGLTNVEFFDGKEVVQALRIVFRDLLDIDTVLHIAELYGPELLVQLPYMKRLNLNPSSVKTAIEFRDLWFAKECRNESYIEHGEAPFAYLGNIALGLHSSIKGTSTKCHSRPIAQALHGLDNGFDPWCKSLWVFDTEQDNVGVDDLLRESLLRETIQDEPYETFHSLDTDSNGLSDEVVKSMTDDSSDSSDDSNLNNGTFEDDSSSPEPEHVANGNWRYICQGLQVDIDKLGFGKDHTFLTMTKLNNTPRNPKRLSAPVLSIPCMTNIASTIYAKKPTTMDTRGCKAQYSTLIDALWVLFTHHVSCQVSAKAASPEVTESQLPSTPAALAVMIHLVVKSFNLDNPKSLGVCNDIEAIYKTLCREENKFLPITAIVGGMFRLNVELNVKGYTYYISNQSYDELWAPGSICYNNGIWHVISQSLTLSIPLPLEKSTSNCHHSGTLAAYVRLNNLKVKQVPSDGYCGFHTVAVLLGLAANSNYKLRKKLVGKTVDYMQKNPSDAGIQVYLQLHETKTSDQLNTLLMQSKRWLSVDEVALILQAHGKLSDVITENSYPIYNPEVTHFLIKDHHYEPVKPLCL